jgi:hypothetical protein
MRLRGRAWAGALALALGLAGAGPAGAGDAQGSAVVDAVDVGRRRVVLDGVAYQIDEDTLITDPDGNEIGLEELPSIAGGAEADTAAVWFETGVRGGGAARLRELRLTGSGPR